MTGKLTLGGVAAAAVALVAALDAPARAEPVNYDAILKAEGNGSDWLTYSRTYHGHRYVPLTQIDPSNVAGLQPVWIFPTGGENRGLEATPLVHDGVIYMAADESRVFAIDARTGVKIWGYDPKVNEEAERVYCCGSANRGVALLDDKVFVGTMDARLVALDKDSGEVVWVPGGRLAAGLQHHRRAARGEGHGADRSRRR
jgi:glucose dehydrogenase